MILVKLNKWNEQTGIKHISTTWEISASKDMKKIITSYVKSSMVDLLYDTTEIPKGLTYYVRYTRHFDRDNVKYDPKIVPVTNVGQVYNNILTREEVVIDKPYVYLDDIKEIYKMSELKIRTSKFRSNVDEHASTHYFIYNDNDELIYFSLNNIENKTSITIPFNYELKNTSELKLRVIHRGSSGAESPIGEQKIKTYNEDYSTFKITTKLINVEPLKDLTIHFEALAADGDPAVHSVEILNSITYDVYKTLQLDSTHNVTIPWYLLKENVVLLLKIWTSNTLQEKGGYVYRYIETTKNTNPNFINTNYVYQDELTDEVEQDIVIPNNIRSHSLYDNTIIMPDPENLKFKSYKFNVETNKFGVHQTEVPGLVMFNKKTDGILIYPCGKSKVGIDMYNAEGVPTFYIYDYNTTTGKFTFLKEISREDETMCLGKSSGLVQHTATSFVYAVYRSNKLKYLNLLEPSIMNLPDIPLEVQGDILLGAFKNNQILINPFNTINAIMYDINRMEYTSDFKFVKDYLDVDSAYAFKLVNGDSMIKVNRQGIVALYNFNNEIIDFKDLKKYFQQGVDNSVMILQSGEVIFTENVDTKIKVRVYK